MKKNIKCFLLTSLFLGFLQLESSAMEEADNNKAAIRKTTVQERRETDDRSHDDMPRIRETAASFSISIEDALSSILTRLQQQSEEIRALTQENRDLQQHIHPLIQENNSLRERIERLENTQNNHFSAFLANNDIDGWYPYTDFSWKALVFNKDGGDARMRESLSYLKIPENGSYKVDVSYNLKVDTIDGDASASVGIAINDRISAKNSVHHHLHKPYARAGGGLERIFDLKQGDKISLFLHGHERTEYHPNTFRLEVEKLR